MANATLTETESDRQRVRKWMLFLSKEMDKIPPPCSRQGTKTQNIKCDLWPYLERWRGSHHLMVLLRLGWLTVLSSMNMVEQELYFLVRRPGDICEETR